MILVATVLPALMAKTVTGCLDAVTGPAQGAAMPVTTPGTRSWLGEPVHAPRVAVMVYMLAATTGYFTSSG